MRIVIPTGFEALYLGAETAIAKGSKNKYMYDVLGVASKKAITRRRWTKAPPLVTDWIKVAKEANIQSLAQNI